MDIGDDSYFQLLASQVANHPAQVINMLASLVIGDELLSAVDVVGRAR